MQKTIEITTTQNVTIEYELALLRERILGFLLDLLLISVGYFVLLQLMQMIFGGSLFTSEWGIFIFLLYFLAFFIYYIFFEIWRIGQTPGKMAMGTKVVRLDGKDPEWGDVVLRTVMHLVDSIFSAGLIGSLLIKTTGKSQRLGDMAANTTVIKIQGQASRFRLQDILSISSLDNHQPTYPQVRNLAERDMIFIKTVLTRYRAYPNQAHREVVEDLVTHLMPLLDIPIRPRDRVEFLRTLLRDYIVLTR